jgi:uncharacterized ion transporter superfamily protein YfcC
MKVASLIESALKRAAFHRVLSETSAINEQPMKDSAHNNSQKNASGGIEARLKKLLTIPDTLIILFGLITAAAIATWIAPAGKYNLVLDAATKRQVIDPESFKYVAQKGQGLLDVLLAVPAGFVGSGTILTMVFMCGACFYLITATGAIDAGLGAALRRLQGSQRYLLILGVMFLSFLLGLRGGAETLLPFVPIAITTAIALGFDSIVGVAIIMISGATGFAVSWVGTAYFVAIGIADIKPMQDVWYRVIICVIQFVIVGAYIYIYCEKIRKDPQSSPMVESDKTLEMRANLDALPEFTGRRKVILVLFLLSFVALIVGALKYSWGLNHFSAFYFFLAIVTGFLWGYSPNEFAEKFTTGCKTMMYGVLMVCFARVISVVMTNGLILDTFTHAVSSVLKGMPDWATASGMFIVHCLINFLIPSGSGQAAATMPIMIPLGDVLGLSRHVNVLAFQFGDCMTNAVTPTAGFFMAALAIGKVPWVTWLRWFLPLMVILIVYSCIMLSIAVNLTFG